MDNCFLHGVLPELDSANKVSSDQNLIECGHRTHHCDPRYDLAGSNVTIRTRVLLLL